MAKKRTPKKGTATKGKASRKAIDQVFVAFVARSGKKPIAAAGAVPAGFRGAYIPSAKELMDAAQAASEVDVKMHPSPKK